MTDEDERIDRAKRIREKLDGGNGAADDGGSAADAADPDDSADAAEDGPTAEGPDGDEPGETDEQRTDQPDAATTPPDGTETDADDKTETDADDETEADADLDDADAVAPADEDEQSADWTTTETVDAAAAAGAPDVRPANDEVSAGDAGSNVGDAESNASSGGEEAVDGAGGGAGDSEGANAAADEDRVTMYVPGAEVGDVEVDVAEMAEQAGLESAADETDGEDEEATRPAGVDAGTDARTSEETRVLEFSLGSEQYCLDIDYVEEIVEYDSATRVPNTPEYVEGVVDLRGQITTVLDPKATFDIDEAGRAEHVVVFDPDAFEEQGAIGWVVDDVDQVAVVSDGEINDSPVQDDHVNGVVDRGADLIIWTSPEDAIEEATG